jgi:hypothetical protein
MDCNTAKLVYSSSRPIDKIRELFPEVFEYLESRALEFFTFKQHPFDSKVKSMVELNNINYRVVHGTSSLIGSLQELLGDVTSRMLIEDYFSTQYQGPIYFNTICCDGHISSDRELTLQEALAIQTAAIKIEINNIE